MQAPALAAQLGVEGVDVLHRKIWLHHSNNVDR
jgi:hypothetical protein